MDRLVVAIAAVAAVVTSGVVYVTVGERILGLLPQNGRRAARPWLWLAPALASVVAFLVLPTVNTVLLSVRNPSTGAWIGLAHYASVLGDPSVQVALRNNLLWIVVFPTAVVLLGLTIALLTDQVRYERVAQAVVFLPMAISFVAAGVIWRLMYEFRPPPLPQTGTLNAFLMFVAPGFDPHAWLNNLALIVAAAWVWTGFCMVVLSAALKGVPSEIREAARVDGATELQAVRFVVIPMLGDTIAVVATTMVIFALKAFDIVYVMTNGNYETEVIANRMYKEMFTVRDFGHASALAVVLLLAVVPAIALNLRRFRQQGAR